MDLVKIEVYKLKLSVDETSIFEETMDYKHASSPLILSREDLLESLATEIEEEFEELDYWREEEDHNELVTISKAEVDTLLMKINNLVAKVPEHSAVQIPLNP